VWARDSTLHCSEDDTVGVVQADVSSVVACETHDTAEGRSNHQLRTTMASGRTTTTTTTSTTSGLRVLLKVCRAGDEVVMH